MTAVERRGIGVQFKIRVRYVEVNVEITVLEMYVLTE